MDKSADLRKWFAEKWVDLSRKKKGGGHPECGRDDADKGSYPKCRPQRAAARMSKKQKTHAVRAKRSKPQGVNGKPTMVATFKKKAMFDPAHFEDTLEMLHSKEAFFKAIRAATKGTLAGAGGRKGYAKVVAAQSAKAAAKDATTAAAKVSRTARRASQGAALPRRHGPFQPGQGGFAPVRTSRRKRLDAVASRAQRNTPDAAAARSVSGGRSAARPSAPAATSTPAAPKASTGQGTQGTFGFASPSAPKPTTPKTGFQKGLSVAKGVGKDALNYAKANPLKTVGGVALAAGAANAMRTPKTNPQTGQPQTSRAGQALRGAAVGAGLAGAAYGGAKLLKKVATPNPFFDTMNSDLRKMASAETAYILDRLQKMAGKKTKAAVLAAGAGAGAKAADPAARGLRSAADAGVAKTKAAMTEDNIRSVAKGARKAMFEGTDKLRAAAKATGDSDVASGVRSLTRAGNVEGVSRIGQMADKATQHSGAIIDKAQTLGGTAKELADHITPGSGALAGAGIAGAALAANKLRKMNKSRKLRKAVRKGDRARARLDK